MPMYNNLSGYGNGNAQQQNNAMNTAPANNVWGNGFDPNTAWGNQQQAQQPAQSMPVSARIFVDGRAGADAYPMPQGVNEITLWDRKPGRVFVKAYDNRGFPVVMEDYDYVDHVEPDPPQYVTKDDIREIIEEVMRSQNPVNMGNYVTRSDMDKALTLTRPDLASNN